MDEGAELEGDPGVGEREDRHDQEAHPAVEQMLEILEWRDHFPRGALEADDISRLLCHAVPDGGLRDVLGFGELLAKEAQISTTSSRH